MNIIRKTMKIILFSILFFIFLTLILALVIKFTPFSEEWGKYGLIVILAFTTMISGYMEGYIIGKKGIFTGFLISVFFVLIILCTVSCIYGSPLNLNDFKGENFIAVISGILGAVIGTNKSK